MNATNLCSGSCSRARKMSTKVQEKKQRSASTGSSDESHLHSAGMAEFSAIDCALLAALIAAYMVPFYWAIPFVDGVRDIQTAISIAQGETLPLTGPIFASKFHLGPVWAYVMAIPLVLHFPAWTVPIFLGMISSTKFIFAYLVGKRLHSRRYALAFAIAMALPGWSGLDFFNSTTPTLVPAMGLACLWFSLRYTSSKSIGDAAAAALTASLAMHAHPSAVLLVTLPMVLSAASAIQQRRLASIFTMFAVGTLPLTPAIWAYFSLGTASVFPNAPTIVVPGTGHTLTGWIDAVTGFVVGGPLTTLHVLGSDASGVWMTIITSILALSGLLACLFSALVSRSALAIGICGMLFALALITFGTRINTPWYFLHPLAVVYAAAIALGWTIIPRAIVALCVLACMLGIAQQILVSQHLNSGEGRFPTAELLDIRRAEGIRGPQLGAWITANDWPDVAKVICEASSEGLSIHGSLAVAFDDIGGLPLHGSCSIANVQLGGENRRHIVGVPRQLWSQFVNPPIATVGSIGVYEPTATLSPSAGQTIADPRIYPLRQQITTPIQTSTFELITPPNSVVIVTRQSPAITQFSVDTVSVEGSKITEIYNDVSVRAYASDQADSENIWTITISTSAPEWVDIVAISAGQVNP